MHEDPFATDPGGGSGGGGVDGEGRVVDLEGRIELLG